MYDVQYRYWTSDMISDIRVPISDIRVPVSNVRYLYPTSNIYLYPTSDIQYLTSDKGWARAKAGISDF